MGNTLSGVRRDLSWCRNKLLVPLLNGDLYRQPNGECLISAIWFTGFAINYIVIRNMAEYAHNIIPANILVCGALLAHISMAYQQPTWMLSLFIFASVKSALAYCATMLCMHSIPHICRPTNIYCPSTPVLLFSAIIAYCQMNCILYPNRGISRCFGHRGSSSAGSYYSY